MDDLDLYEVLGVPRNATSQQIKDRFRFLSHAYHPDKFATHPHRVAAEHEFKRINAAYQILSDPLQRAHFDTSDIRAFSSSEFVEITTAHPDAFIAAKSTQMSVYGFRLGMPMDETERLLKRSPILKPVPDADHADRIYVYDKGADGNKDKCILYFIWNSQRTLLKTITIFQDFRSHLQTALKRLLTFEAVDDTSDFKKRVLGYANRSKVTLDVPSIGLKHVTYYYRDRGISITHKVSSDSQEVVFSISSG